MLGKRRKRGKRRKGLIRTAPRSDGSKLGSDGAEGGWLHSPQNVNSGARGRLLPRKRSTEYHVGRHPLKLASKTCPRFAQSASSMRPIGFRSRKSSLQ